MAEAAETPAEAEVAETTPTENEANQGNEEGNAQEASVEPKQEIERDHEVHAHDMFGDIDAGEEDAPFEDEESGGDYEFLAGAEMGEMGEMDEFLGDEYDEYTSTHASYVHEVKSEDQEAAKANSFLDTETVKIAGDFKKSVTIDADKRYDKVYDLDEEEEEEEMEEDQYEEEEQVEEEHEEIIIEREPLYAKYYILYPDYNKIKTKNNFLQKKMVEYFSKRKMDHVMKEDSNYDDNYRKYCNKLDIYYGLKKKTQKTKDELLTGINTVRDRRASEQLNLQVNKERVYAREKEIGTGLILAKTGKEIPEKLVERLIRNQKHKCEEMTSLRLLFIKIRDKINDMETACEALDKIGDHYTIMDYEQLKIERRNHTDKIEERDEELSRLRISCSNAIQCLAHIREKLSSVQVDIFRATQKLSLIEKERLEIREKVNANKKQRDLFRYLTSKLKEEAGLLTKPKLLRDMEDTEDEVNRLRAEMNSIIAQTAKYKAQTENIKKHIGKYRRNTGNFRKGKDVFSSSKKSSTVFKGRPSILTLKDSVCDDFLKYDKQNI